MHNDPNCFIMKSSAAITQSLQKKSIRSPNRKASVHKGEIAKRFEFPEGSEDELDEYHIQMFMPDR